MHMNITQFSIVLKEDAYWPSHLFSPNNYEIIDKKGIGIFHKFSTIQTCSAMVQNIKWGAFLTLIFKKREL